MSFVLIFHLIVEFSKLFYVYVSHIDSYGIIYLKLKTFIIYCLLIKLKTPLLYFINNNHLQFKIFLFLKMVTELNFN